MVAPAFPSWCLPTGLGRFCPLRPEPRRTRPPRCEPGPGAGRPGGGSDAGQGEGLPALRSKRKTELPGHGEPEGTLSLEKSGQWCWSGRGGRGREGPASSPGCVGGRIAPWLLPKPRTHVRGARAFGAGCVRKTQSLPPVQGEPSSPFSRESPSLLTQDTSLLVTKCGVFAPRQTLLCNTSGVSHSVAHF